MRPIRERFFLDAELAIRARRLSFHIVQIGLDDIPRAPGVSTRSPPAVVSCVLSEPRAAQ